MEQIEKHKNELSAAKIKKIEAEAENARLHRLIETLEECEYPLTEFDEKIWNKTIEKVLIYEDKISYFFLDGCCEDVVRTDKKQKKIA